jgi:hypothetical protein
MPAGKQHTFIGRTVEGLNIFTTYKGIYNNSTTYNVGNIVRYENSFYIRINSSGAGNLPTDANYWSVYSQ